jgi:hypothetical protein
MTEAVGADVRVNEAMPCRSNCEAARRDRLVAPRPGTAAAIVKSETAMNRPALFLLCACLGGCASHQPVVYSGPAGTDRASTDAAIAECSQLAEAAGASRRGGTTAGVAGDTARGAATGAAAGAVGGAIAGNAGRGAGIGAASAATATLVRKIFAPGSPNPAFRNYVDRCLRERGYEVVGWQ